ncbi:MAG TPA: flagellar biosynthetic protein FliO [Bryocella sp.]|nr:flagellar biosynthetic protein FliO [Bryocella sp.]
MRSRSHAVLVRRASRRLSVNETVSLGEKRFVSILSVDGEQFLVGGSSSNVVLLAKLDKGEPARGEPTSVSECFGDLTSRAGRSGTPGVSPRVVDPRAGL